MPRMECALVTLLLILLTPSPAPTCSLCGYQIKKSAFSQEWSRSHVVIYGYAVDSRLNVDAAALPGSGSTNFRIEKVLKKHAGLGAEQVLKLNRYIPVLDPKAPPRLVAFFNVSQDKLVFQHARQVRSQAVIEYLEGAQANLDKDRVAALLYYARFVDHQDDQIAEDAFLEFARSTDQEVGKAAKELAPERFRTLLTNPKLDAERISLFAFLLGSCGGPRDADFLKGLFDQPTAETGRALDGILGGYIALRPREGWELAARVLADPKRPFHHRHALVRMVRFYHGWKPQEYQREILRCYQVLIPDSELADFAIEDLRQWKTWEMTGAILAQFGQKSHEVPIIRRSIVRYALSCPLAEARQFVDRVRRQDQNLVRELEEDLAFDARK